MKAITHIIFDMDGVLLDTEKFYTEVTQAIVQRYGKNFSWEIKAQMLGRKPSASSKILVEALDLPITPEQYLHDREALLNQLFPTAQPTLGAVEFTQYLHSKKIPQAVATSTPRHLFELKTTLHRQWFSQFDHIVTGDHPEVKASKPAPDIFLIAAAAIQAKPEHCLVFEDSPAGIEAAKAAGMRVVAITDPVYNPEIYRDADAKIASFADFKPEEWGL